jgi:hypothetical protein
MEDHFDRPLSLGAGGGLDLRIIACCPNPVTTNLGFTILRNGSSSAGRKSVCPARNPRGTLIPAQLLIAKVLEDIMATWGEFIQEIKVQKLNPGGMVVRVDDVITLWEERNALRVEVARLTAALASERSECAQEVEEFADACAAESEDAAVGVALLRAAAQMLRERGQKESDEITAVERIEPEEEPPPAAEPPPA